MDRISKIKLLNDIMKGGSVPLNLLMEPYKPSLEEMKLYISIFRLRKEDKALSDDDVLFVRQFENKASAGLELSHFSDKELLIDIMGGVYKKLCDNPFTTCHTKDCKCEPIIDVPDWL